MITTYLNGRLGNNLFQYIFCRIAALESNCNFYIPKNKVESDNLYGLCSGKLSVNLEKSKPTNPHYWLGDEIFNINYGVFDDYLTSHKKENDFELTNVQDIKNGTLLEGYYQTDNYMWEYRDKIINTWLPFKDDIIFKSKHILEKYNVGEYCYIHFRGKDYKGIKQFYLPIDYYTKAIDKIKEVSGYSKFLIITDDVVEAFKFFPEYEIVSNDVGVDFYLLTKSKYSIICNSSFSWWASWMNEMSKIVIAPNKWFNYNGNYGEGFYPHHIKTDKFYYI
jgi:hypothetical protein